MHVYRLAPARYATDISGEGARVFGGRWNRPGHAALYTSESRALAVLETLANTSQNAMTGEFCFLVLEVPEGAGTSLAADDLPDQWRTSPAPKHLAEVGSRWLCTADELVLSVPSAIVPQERNFLINPLCSSIDQLVLCEVEPFSFDRRFAGKP